MTRHLSNQDIEEMDKLYMDRKEYLLGKPQEDKRKKKDRRKAINSCIDPAMDRRFHTRRKNDRTI